MMPETKASRELKEITPLFEISTKLSETLDLKTVLQPILQMTTEYMGILRSTLTILNRKKGEIVIEEAYGLPQSPFYFIPFYEGLLLRSINPSSRVQETKASGGW